MKKMQVCGVTLALVAANILMFVPGAFLGEAWNDWGTISVLELFRGNWYRLLTSMFLHGGVEHLFWNMISLYFLGSELEKEVGHARFLTLYLLSGIGGNLVSCGYEYLTRTARYSLGASGAVFGIMGALAVIVLTLRRKRRRPMDFFFMVVYPLIAGFRDPTINNAAHIGGLLCGLLIGWIYVWYVKSREREWGHEFDINDHGGM